MLQSKIFQGKRIRLTGVTQKDLPTLGNWWADDDFLRHYDAVVAFPKSEEQLLKRIQQGQEGVTTFLFGIRLLSAGRLIGLLELDGILWNHGTTHLSIAIGDPADRRQGYATEAMKLGLKYAFHELNLHRVSVTVFSFNRPALGLYEKLGFTHEGSYREYILRDGERHDMLIYGLLRREWEARVGAGLQN